MNQLKRRILIKSGMTDPLAMHKGSALKKLKSKQ